MLKARQGTSWWTVTGHYGPNPKTKAEALQQIEEFRKIVANAPFKEKDPC